MILFRVSRRVKRYYENLDIAGLSLTEFQIHTKYTIENYNYSVRYDDALYLAVPQLGQILIILIIDFLTH